MVTSTCKTHRVQERFSNCLTVCEPFRKEKLPASVHPAEFQLVFPELQSISVDMATCAVYIGHCTSNLGLGILYSESGLISLTAMVVCGSAAVETRAKRASP